MQLKHFFFAWVACAVALSVAPSATWATTFVLMDEQELAAASAAVVSGWVTGVEAHADPVNGGVNTYVSIEPMAVLAGTLPDGEIVLRERGGQVPGRIEKVFGAPEYVVGEQVVVFLSPDADGSLHTTAMAMGKYDVQPPRGGAATVSRHLGAEVRVLDRATGRPHVSADVADLGQFEEHVRAAHHHPRRPGNHRHPVRLTPPELGLTAPHSYESPFTYLGNPSRWFEPDFAQPVLYQIDASGDARNGPVASRSAVNSAFAAWTNVPNSSLVLSDGGLLDAPLPFAGCTGPSRIVFNDPFNEITDPSGCGGILAIGGYCSSAETKSVNGTTFQRITLGKVVFNNGWEQCDIWNACNLAEVATHEIGHTIGLGHSADDTATMAAVAHFDERCASLGSDDITAAQFIYPEHVSPTATAPAAPQPTPTSTPRQPTPTYTGAPPPTATFTRVAATPTFTNAPQPPPTALVPPVLPNDSVATPLDIVTTPFSHNVSTVSATVDPSGPAPACGNRSAAKSVWYRFAPPSNGTLSVDTFGSNYDTILAAFTRSSNTFTPVGCNDDSGGAQSRLAFQARAGTAYYFMVTAYGNNGGNLVLHVSFQGTPSTPPTATPSSAARPTFSPTPTITPSGQRTAPPSNTGLPNDTCAGATEITATPYSASMATVAATTESNAPAPWCGNQSRGKSVWYRFTAPASGTIVAQTSGSNYDTILAAFAGSCPALSPVACNDDFASMQSRVAVQTLRGMTYYFLVTAYRNDGGALVFQLTN